MGDSEEEWGARERCLLHVKSAAKRMKLRTEKRLWVLATWGWFQQSCVCEK